MNELNQPIPLCRTCQEIARLSRVEDMTKSDKELLFAIAAALPLSEDFNLSGNTKDLDNLSNKYPVDPTDLLF